MFDLQCKYTAKWTLILCLSLCIYDVGLFYQVNNLSVFITSWIEIHVVVKRKYSFRLFFSTYVKFNILLTLYMKPPKKKNLKRIIFQRNSSHSHLKYIRKYIFLQKEKICFSLTHSYSNILGMRIHHSYFSIIAQTRILLL